MEPVYGTVIQLARLVWRLQGLTFTVTGVENLPVTGGAVIAINHTSYFDFTFAGLPAYKQGRGRKVRFMAKKEVFDHKITGPIMRSLRHIEVDRDSGAASFERGLPDSSRKASWSASTPRRRSAAASRSRSSSRARRGWRSPPTCRSSRTSSGALSGSGPRAIPKKMWRPKVPISVAVGEPIPPTLPATELTALLHSRMQHLLERVQDAYGPHPPGEFWVPHRLGGGAPTLAEANRMDAEEAAEKAARREQRGPTRSAGVAATWNRSSARWRSPSRRRWRSPGRRITYHGLENIPDRGGAVVAINHTSYIDWLPAALAAYKRHRRLRFMIKEEMREVKVVSFLIKHTGTIPVDRRAGAGAYAVAVERLRAGELVGVYPEATISRSFELKEFKTGAARMAHRGAGADHPADRLGCTPDAGPRTIRASSAARRFRSP